VKIAEIAPGIRSHAGLLIGLVVASAFTEGFGLLLLVPMLAALGPGGAETGRIAEFMERLGIPLALAPLLILFVALVVLRALIAYARTIVGERLQMSLVEGLRQRAWSALLHADWRMLVSMRQSDNMSQLVTDIDRVGHGVHQAVAGVAAAVTLAGLGLATLAISPAMTLAAAMGGALVLLAYRKSRRRAAELGDLLTKAFADVHGGLSEGLDGLRVIKSFGREAAAEQEVAGGYARVRELILAYRRSNGRGQILLQGGGAIVLALLVWLGVTQWQAQPATILPLVALFARAMPLVGALQEGMQSWAFARPALQSTLGLIATAEAAREPEALIGGAPPLERSITLDKVLVRFPGRNEPALEIASLTFPAHTVTALTGPSGSGKSTLADLISGLITPDAGTIAVDDVALDGPLQRGWRERVAYVQQEPVLFNGTIRDNLLWALPHASEARMEAALRDASAGFVFALAKGLDTPVGDTGRQFSGGERQRIVLARALLRDPQLLILDEATSALDAANEAAIADALTRLKGRLTIVIIGHRGALSGVADRHVILNAGQPVTTDDLRS
jgi:ATP-binding cassette subfamily C protein